MGDKKKIEDWYEELNKQFEEDAKSNDYSNPKMEQWFAKALDEKMCMEDKESIEKWYEKMNKQFEEDAKTQDFSNPEMDKWFYAMLEKNVREGDKKGTEEWYEELNKQFEADSKTHNYSDPEMDRIFAEMLDKEMRKRRKGRIAKATGIVASVVLVLSIALNGFTKVAYGESLFEIIRHSIEAGQFTVSGISKNDDSEFEDYDAPIIQYKANSIEALFEQVMTDAKIDELFYVADIIEKHGEWVATYDKEFQTLTINSKQENNYLYVYEEFNYDDIVSGTIVESEIVSTVFNENLQMDIDIITQMDNIRHKGYYLEVFYDNMRIKIEGNGTLEEFEIIAKNLSLVKGK